jgi:hypothetical protein
MTNDRIGLTRSAMFLFVFIIHAVGNLRVFLGPGDCNGYGCFLAHLFWIGFGFRAYITEEYFLPLPILLRRGSHVHAMPSPVPDQLRHRPGPVPEPLLDRLGGLHYGGGARHLPHGGRCLLVPGLGPLLPGCGRRLRHRMCFGWQKVVLASGMGTP